MCDELFDEVTDLSSLFKKIPDHRYDKVQPEVKWTRLNNRNESSPLLKIVFIIPMEDPFVERLFLLVSGQCTKK